MKRRGSFAHVFGLATLPLIVSTGTVLAGPDGGQVISGTASIAQSGATTTIDQASLNLALDWHTFDIAAHETVNFVQPSASAIAVNRIFDTNGTQILGRLSANGQVFLINPNGILFGHEAQVNVGGLVASTLDIGEPTSNSTHFSGGGTGSVSNHGTINAANGGYVALLGNQVSNQGTIAAPLGSIALGAGSAVTLTFENNSLVTMQVDRSVLNSLVDNGGLIRADGGTVVMSAGAKDSLLASVVNNTGMIEARTVENRDGTIILLGGMAAGTANVGGTLNAGAPNGDNGGFIETSAAHVRIAPNAIVTTAAPYGATGRWLIDPQDFTIAASGGDMTGALLGTALGLSNVTIQSTAGAVGASGDIHVDDGVTWSANRLTLQADRNININTAMFGSGTASLALEYGQGAVAAGNLSLVNVRAPVNLPTGNNLSMTLGLGGAVVSYAVINDMSALQGINGNLAGNYALGSNLNATGVAGFLPIGPFSAYNDYGNRFSGAFDGLGHTISNLTISRPGNNYVAMFGSISEASTIKNVGLVNANVAGAAIVGALVAFNFGAIRNSYATGAVQGYDMIGGLVGYNSAGTISNSYSSAAITGGSGYWSSTGGLLGTNYWGTVSDSHATGSVTGNVAGGLVGENNNGTINNSYSTGLLTSPVVAGGLVARGTGSASAVNNSYWNVTTSGQAGSAGGTGLTTAQLQAALPAGFSPAIWGNGGNQTTPYLLSNPGFVLIAANTSATYYEVVLSLHELQAMNSNLAGRYALGNDIDAGATSTWNAGAGFAPLGDATVVFSGSLDGLGHTIANLTIDRPATDHVGLFGYAQAAQIHNVGLVNADITGRDAVGALVGTTVVGTATGNYATGQVTGRNRVGGLLGYNNSMGVGSSYATSNVTGVGSVGGLMGETNGGVLATGNYASGNVTGSGNAVGGFVGYNGFAFVITDSYATGNVIGGSDVGGFAGYHYNGLISDSYAAGSVTGASDFGGLIGRNAAAQVTDSFWNSQTSGQLSSAGGTALTTAQMQQRANFTGWDFAAIWTGYDGFTQPLLRAFMTPLTVTSTNATKSYDGLAFSGGNGATYSTIPNGNLLGALSYGGNSQGAIDAGSYTLAGSGLYSNQHGYIVSYVNGALTVDPADLTLGTSDVSKTYDGGLTAAGSAAVTGGTLFGSDTLDGGTFAFTDKNVGSGDRTVTTSGVTVDDGNGGANYNVSYADNTTSTISAAELTVIGVTADDKIYDGTIAATLSGTAAVAALGADDVTVMGAGSGEFADAQVGAGKAVAVDGFTLGGADAGNYVVVQPMGLSADITAVVVADIPPVIPPAIPPVVPPAVDPPVTVVPSVNTPAAIPEPVLNAMTHVASTLVAPQARAAPAGSSATNAQAFTLQVIDGGVNMPGYAVNDDE